jgi:predicted P-loop ATPase
MNENERALNKAAVTKRIKELVAECRQGKSDREDDAIAHAQSAGLDENGIREEFAQARKTRKLIGSAEEVAKKIGVDWKGDGRRAIEADEVAKLRADDAIASGSGSGSGSGSASAGLLGLQHSRNPSGYPPSLENALIALKALRLNCRYDVFHDKTIVDGHAAVTNGDALENLDNVVLMLRHQVLTRFRFDPGPSYMRDALQIECMNHSFDPVRDYLDTLTWDGKPRLDRWLIDYCSATDTPLNRSVGRKVLVAAVRRVRSPGCKFDYLLVLEGDQGQGKSTMLKILAGEDNFCDNEILGSDKKEQQESVQGVWIYEIAELDGIHKSEVTKVKLFVSKTIDMARPAFGRSRVDRKRRGIFIATTNDDNYLRDTTGNRRFWPVKLNGKIDLFGIERDRDQLWAEAAEVEATGETLVIPEDLWGAAAVQQKARMNEDVWEGMISAKLSMYQQGGFTVDGDFALASDANGNSEWRVSTNFLLSQVLSISPERRSDAVTKRLAGVMRSLGWTRPESTIRIGKGADPCRGFTLSEKPPAIEKPAETASDAKTAPAALDGEVLAPSVAAPFRRWK